MEENKPNEGKPKPTKEELRSRLRGKLDLSKMKRLPAVAKEQKVEKLKTEIEKFAQANNIDMSGMLNELNKHK